MNVSGKHYRTIWLNEDNSVGVIDQRFLPHRFVVAKIISVAQMAEAIKEMQVRGAGLIGAAAGYGMFLAALEAMSENNFDECVWQAAWLLKQSRPTAVNLEWAVNRQLKEISTGKSVSEKILIAKNTANKIADEDAENCFQIGKHGVRLLEEISKKKNGEAVNILTHCNAGWLAFVDYGSALAPVYEAFERKIKVHVWVSETRPRNQGANLTAWELQNHGVPHTIVADNICGHLMQNSLVDLVITGADRVSRSGNAANKIGTYLKALAARDNNIPFYVALPSSTFDWNITSGKEIHIEERSGDEVKFVAGLHNDKIKNVLISPVESKALNFAFDVTPANLISGLITERGICCADKKSILNLFAAK